MMKASCPSCGAELNFISKASLYAVCSYCSSLSLRTDLDVRKIGEVSAIQEDLTPIQLGTKGRFRNTNFTVIGRLQIQYDRGFWNEWHLQTSKGEEAWLGEAQGNYVFTKRYKTPENVPAFESLKAGQRVQLGRTFYVQDIRTSKVVSGEGELPFEVKGGYEAPVVDLAGKGRNFATLDYSEETPILFVGFNADFEELHLRHLRNPLEVAKPKAETEGFQCACCGHPQEIRAPGQSLTVACPACGSVLDAADPQHKVIQEYHERLRPLAIPLGQRGKFRDVDYICLGAVEREGSAGGETWYWMEYLLWNPYGGYRWLSTYGGHWSFVKTCVGRVEETKEKASYEGDDYKSFQTADANTSYVVGEFPWEIRRGDRVLAKDFIAPPYMLSREANAKEIVWSRGEYVEPAEVATAFGITDIADPVGVFPNQPSPYDASKTPMTKLLVVFLALAFFLQLAGWGGAARQEVYRESFTADLANKPTTEPGVVHVTDFFELDGGKSNLEIRTVTDISQGWGYFSYALINYDTDEALNIGKEISLYSGSDYREGDNKETFKIGSVPPGKYYLRIEVQGDRPVINYTVFVRHDVSHWLFFFLALCLLFYPFAHFQKKRLEFEKQRWEESDFPIGQENDRSGCFSCLGCVSLALPILVFLYWLILS